MSESVAFIRPATLADLDSFIAFAKETGPGVTTLPRDTAYLEENLAHSELSFNGLVGSSQKEVYLFCLEYNGKVIGTSGLVSRIGLEAPFFAFHKRLEKHYSPSLPYERDIPVLHFIEARKKPTEIGTLFLKKEFRGFGFGPLLSFSRFLFLALHRPRFAPIVIAELRGVNVEGVSPFWEGVGRHFFALDFSEADLLRVTNPSIIEDLFPRYPLYSILLPKEAQKVIGVVHPRTLPAKWMLEKEGFRLSNYVDIFDAGPHLYAPTDEISAVKHSKKAQVLRFVPHLSTPSSTLIGTTKNTFRATLSPAIIEEAGVTLPIQCGEILHLEKGDQILFYEFFKKTS